MTYLTTALVGAAFALGWSRLGTLKETADRLMDWAGWSFCALDALLGFWLQSWLYVWRDGPVPSRTWTVSEWVGRLAIEGHKGGLFWEKVIDAMFRKGHCRVAATRGKCRLPGPLPCELSD